jgi:hypothetical protein
VHAFHLLRCGVMGVPPGSEIFNRN